MAKAEEKAPAQRPGFDEKGKAYKGVDPETGERVTVTLEALKDEFGPKRGERMYRRVAEAAGVAGLVTAGAEYSPDISLAGMDEGTRKKVDAILSEKE